MYERIRTSRIDLEKRKKSLLHWKVPKSVRVDVLRFLDELELGRVNRGVKASADRQVKYLHVLRAPLEFFNKDLRRIRLADVEAFERDLSSDRIKSRLKGRRYSDRTKVDMRYALKVFLRWKLGEAAAVKLVGWLDTRNKHKTPDYLKESEVETLFNKCRTAEQRYVVAVLFDSGARAGEF